MNSLTYCDVRVLGPDDTALMQAMLAMFAAAFEDPKTYASAPPSTSYLRDRLGDRHFFALAALHDGEIVGALAAYELVKFEQQRSEIYIYDLAVLEDHRRRGVATALISKLQAIAAECGAYVIFVQADLGDDPAIELYTKIGVREDVLHFDIAPK